MTSYLTFNSYEFILAFLPVTVAVYWALRTTRYVNWWLAAASLFFYATAGPIYLIPLLFTCIFDFYVGNRLAAPISPARRKFRS